MPELPEVEVTRRALEPHLVGRALEAVVVRQPRLRQPVPEGLDALLRGAVLEALERRGKYLLWRFAKGTLISHLGMTGVWRIHPRPAPAPRAHDHLDLVFRGALARLTDPRRFGAVLWHPVTAGDVQAHPALARLGVEPFEARFDGAWLHRYTRGRRVAIKPLLLGGQVVVGVGNIYCSESLFRAGIDPRSPAGRLSAPRCARLAAAVREVLAEAIAVGGSTLRDFVSAEGAEGYFMREAAVYGREGLPCRVCGTPVRRLVQGQRATYWCPLCQRR